ncbi:MAG: nucleoside diphosphate kinase regulator [Betaproteobacteria bacterium]
MNQEQKIILTAADFARLNGLVSDPGLAAELDKALIVDARRAPRDLVTMNSRVRYQDESTGEIREITIVYPQDSNPSAGDVSVLAPVGTALLGLTVGQSIHWPFPDGGSRDLRVVEVIRQPEADERVEA